jgi:DNA-binding NarL/FixJ family response regulator
MITTVKELDEIDKKILILLTEGKTAKQIGKAVFKSSRTVEGRLKRIRDAYDCKNTLQLIAKLNK